jgi:hypothetical protein
MAVMRAFEIHTYQRGRWIIDSVFDDKDLALFEARRMDDTGRFPGIRVVEEIFDDVASRTQSRTLYRGSKVAQANEDALERAKEQRQAAVQARRKREADGFRRRQKAAVHAKARKANPYRLIAILSALTALAIGALLGLNQAQTMLW